jgi:hypothetical protein
VKASAAGDLAAILGSVTGDSSARKKKRKKKKRNKPESVCADKNWCIDRSQTCGPEGGYGKCLVEARGKNLCGELLFQARSCVDCEPPNCTDCVCVLATGGGDRCNNGINGYEFVCVREV